MAVARRARQGPEDALEKVGLGTKRVCPSCTSRFYDLSRRPIECPKCRFTFEPEALLRPRRPRPEARDLAAVAKAPVPEPVEEEAVDEEVLEEADEELVEDEVLEGDEVVEADVEAGEAVPAAEAKRRKRKPVPAADAEEVVLADDDEDVDVGEEDVLVEALDEDEDVSDIVEADIEEESSS